MQNSERAIALREFTRETGCQTITEGNDILIRIGGQLYDFKQVLPQIETLNIAFSWDDNALNGCHLEVYSGLLTEDVVLRINDFFEYVEDEDLTETEDML